MTFRIWIRRKDIGRYALGRVAYYWKDLSLNSVKPVAAEAESLSYWENLGPVQSLTKERSTWLIHRALVEEIFLS